MDENAIALNFVVNPTLLAVAGWIVFVILYGIFSAIIVYHWKSYAANAEVISKTLRVYFISTSVLLLIAAGAIIFI